MIPDQVRITETTMLCEHGVDRLVVVTIVVEDLTFDVALPVTVAQVMARSILAEWPT